MSWESLVLSLLTEDGVEGVLSWLGGWHDGDLDVHHLGPGRVGLGSEDGDSVEDFIVDLVDGRVEGWDDDDTGTDGQGGGGGGNSGNDPLDDILNDY